MDSKVKELLTNSFFFTLASLGSKILVFLMMPFYTYILSPSEYGVAGIVQTIATLLLPLMTAKIQDAVLRFCFINGINRLQVFSIGMKVSLMGVFATIILAVVFGFLPLFDELHGYMIFIPLTVFSTSMFYLMSHFSRGIGNVKQSAVSGVLSTFVVVTLNILFLLWLRLGVIGYLLSYVIADLVAVAYLIYSSKLYKYITVHSDKVLVRQMLAFSLPLVPTSLSWWLLSSFNNFYILSVLGVSAVGLYAAAMRIPSILTVLSDIFSQAWLLSALKNYGSEESKIFIKAVHRKFFAMLSFMTGGITLLTYPIAKLLLSGEFLNCWKIIPLLFVSVFWGGLVGFYGSIFSAENKTAIQMVSTMAGALVSILVVVLFLERFGLAVVSASITIGYFVVWLIRKLILRQYIDIGMSTLECLFQGCFLTGISVLVSHELYWFAALVYLLLLMINHVELLSISHFFLKEFAIYIKQNKL